MPGKKFTRYIALIYIFISLDKSWGYTGFTSIMPHAKNQDFMFWEQDSVSAGREEVS